VGRYIARRLGWTVVVLLAISTLTFAATFLSPIDPAKAYAGPRADAALVARVRRDFGLNAPIYVQYGRFLERLAHGNLGTSYGTGEDVRSAIASRLPATAELALAGELVALLVGLPVGLVAALRHQKLLDRILLTGSLGGVVTPPFVLGFFLLYVLSFRLGWFPLGGNGSASSILLPAVTLGLPGAAWYARMLRSMVLNILNEDYVRSARAKGMPERIVVFRHITRPALAPIVTMIGLDFGVFFGGVLVIEQVFDWPGVGLQAWQALSLNDIPMVMGTVLVAGFFVAIFNLVADVLNALLDPRVAYS
jgi:peptide/nickel transport system permease protein